MVNLLRPLLSIVQALHRTMDYLDTTQITTAPTALIPKVLIVEENVAVGEQLTELVGAAGFQARVVSTGASALAALREDFSHIVIADVAMPDMDGLTLCRTIRSEPFDSYVYVVLLTAQDSDQDILAGFEAGADDYLSERLSPAHLLARLRTAKRILALEHSLRTVIDEKSRLATTDPLTGASNRRYFTRHLGQEIKRAQRFGARLALLLLDIDHFKRINDCYGHAVGDEVLQEFARRVAACVPRKCDWYARLGGEEFAVVLPETCCDDAAMVAERVRAAVAGSAFATTSGPVSVTVSIGVSGIETLLPDVRGSVRDMLESADRCLYASKNRGRNQVTVAESADAALPVKLQCGSR